MRVSAYLPSGKNGANPPLLYALLKKGRCAAAAAEFSQANSRRSAGRKIIARRAELPQAISAAAGVQIARRETALQQAFGCLPARRRKIIARHSQGVSRGVYQRGNLQGRAFGNAVQNFRRRRLYIGAAKVPVHSRHSVQQHGGKADVFVLMQAIYQRGGNCAARNAAASVRAAAAFSRLATSPFAKSFPPSDDIARNCLAAKFAKRAFGIRGAAFGIRGVLRHLQESGAFAGARRKSGAPCCAVRRFPPRRRYRSHPNSRQLSAFVFFARANFFRHLSEQNSAFPYTEKNSSLHCLQIIRRRRFFCRCGGTPLRDSVSRRGGISVNCQQRGRRKPPVQRPRESDFRQFGEFAPVTPFSAISAAKRADNHRRGEFGRKFGRKRKEFGIHITGRKSGFAVAVLFAGFRAAPPKAAAVLCL